MAETKESNASEGELDEGAAGVKREGEEVQNRGSRDCVLSGGAMGWHEWNECMVSQGLRGRAGGAASAWEASRRAPAAAAAGLEEGRERPAAP